MLGMLGTPIFHGVVFQYPQAANMPLPLCRKRRQQ
jgi:hypothetical protein